MTNDVESMATPILESKQEVTVASSGDTPAANASRATEVAIPLNMIGAKLRRSEMFVGGQANPHRVAMS